MYGPVENQYETTKSLFAHQVMLSELLITAPVER